MENIEKVIGIELGTTYSCVGIWENGKVTILENEFAKTTTPSIVSFDNKKINVGFQQKKHIIKIIKTQYMIQNV